ncbi:uncharacterized protein G2W53_015671 [Senna tora]|uniref:Uncharacterized protein n=1 Tax=Senna tora TaxID=362788 RepID=A0A834WWS2_9FABA|nr:uncharacterized protein G2W53_015671 [Senna tora]
MEGDFRQDSRRKIWWRWAGVWRGGVGVGKGWGWVWKIDGVGGGDLGKSEKEEERDKISGEILARKYGGGGRVFGRVGLGWGRVEKGGEEWRRERMEEWRGCGGGAMVEGKGGARAVEELGKRGEEERRKKNGGRVMVKKKEEKDKIFF